MDLSNNLTRFDRDGLELILNTKTGEAFASASAIARMVSTSEKIIDPKQITSYGETLCRGLKIDKPFESQIQTNGGVQGVKLYDEKAIREFAKKYNPDLLDKFAECGIRVYLHQLAGFEVTSSAIATKPVDPIDALIVGLQEIKAIQARQAQLEKETSDLKEIVQHHDCELDRVFNPNGHYFSILGYFRLKGVNVSLAEALRLGRKASKLSMQQGVPVDTVKDPRFGKVNAYSEHILDQLL